MKNYKKWLSYGGVYIAGLLTAYIIFRLIPSGIPTAPPLIRHDTMTLQHAPNLKKNSNDINDLMAKMQSNFRNADDNQNEDLMAQFHDMRKKMLQLLQEEGGSPNLAFGNLVDTPDTNIESKEDDKNYYFEIDLTNIDQNSLKMDIKDGYLYVTGEMKKETQEQSNMGVSSSMVISSFSKTVPIPSDANPKKAKIEQHDAVLPITLPKRGS